MLLSMFESSSKQCLGYINNELFQRSLNVSSRTFKIHAKIPLI